MFNLLEIILFVAILFFGVMIVQVFWSKRQAGSLLLAFGKPNQWLLCLGIVILVAAFINIIFQGLTALADLSEFLSPLSLLLIGFYSILQGSSKVEIRRKGIWYMGLYQWKQIESYAWREYRDMTFLTLKYRQISRFSRFLNPSLRPFFAVNPIQKPSVDKVLRQYLYPHEDQLANSDYSKK